MWSIRIDDESERRNAMMHYIDGKGMDGHVYLNKKT
jgi:hypothetical protein